MLKKTLSILGTFSLICFSFYYTDVAIDVIRKTDPIMKEIINYSNFYGNTSIEASLVNNNFIPGVKGSFVDLEKSYNNMKRLGYFDESLIVFEESLPSSSINNTYNYYIISGNKEKNKVSLVFIFEDTSFIEDIIKILNSKDVKATFFINDIDFSDSLDLVKLILLSGHEVELFSKTYDSLEIKKYSSMKKILTGRNLSYCYTNLKNTLILNNCKEQKMHTIIPSIITGNYLYNDVKKNLDNGSIISISNNYNAVRELSSTINYIFQKGKEIVLVSKLLEE